MKTNQLPLLIEPGAVLCVSTLSESKRQSEAQESNSVVSLVSENFGDPTRFRPYKTHDVDYAPDNDATTFRINACVRTVTDWRRRIGKSPSVSPKISVDKR